MAKESEEEGDLLVGDHRLESRDGHFSDDYFMVMVMMIFEVIS